MLVLRKVLLDICEQSSSFFWIQITDLVNCVHEILLEMNDWNERILRDTDRGIQRNCRKSCPNVT